MASAGLHMSTSLEKEGGDTSSHMSDFWDAAMMGPWPPGALEENVHGAVCPPLNVQ